MNRDIRHTVSPAPIQQQQPVFIQQQTPMRYVAYPPPQQVQMPPHQPTPYNQAHPQSMQQHQMQPPPMASTTACMQQRPDCGNGAACLPSPMPLHTQQQQDPVMMWGMQNYVMPRDSGFQSRATRSVVSTATSGYSNLSSITGMDSECGDHFGGYPGAAGPSGSVYVQPGGDIAGGNFEYAGGQHPAGCLGPAQHPFLQGQGGTLLYPDSQGEMQRVLAATHHLTKLLRDDGDLQSARGAAFFLHNMAKAPENARLIVQSSELIDSFVAAMHSGMERKDDEMLKSTTGIFYVLSNTDQIQADGLEAIYRSGAIPLLIRLLSGECEFEAVLNYSMTVVHNLLSFHPKATEVIRAADAVPPLVRLLSRDHDKFLAIVTDSLRMLCSRHAEAQIKVCEGGGPAHLVRILEHSNYEKVLWTTARLFQVLSNCQCNKQTIVEAGGIQALSRHLAHPSHRLVVNCMDALRNLSDCAMFETGVDTLLSSLIQNLGSSDERVVGYCVSILYNLTCKNATNKAYVCRQMGIESLARTLNERWFTPGIVEDILGVLRHLTWRWAGVRESRNKLRSVGCLPLISRYLRVSELPAQFADYPGVIIEALALIRNLTMDGGASWEDFRRYNIVKTTAELAIDIRNLMNHVIKHDPPRFNKSVEMMERALLALAGLCQDETNRQMLLAEPVIVELATELMNHPLAARSLTEAATICLDQMRRGQTIPKTEMMNDCNVMMKQEDRYPCEDQYQAQASAAFGEPFNMDHAMHYHHQQLPDEMQAQQEQRQPMAMPSPMPWTQQEVMSASYRPMDYDNPSEFFDYGIANSLLNDVEFELYDAGGSLPGANVAGPSHHSSGAADEAMKNLHL